MSSMLNPDAFMEFLRTPNGNQLLAQVSAFQAAKLLAPPASPASPDHDAVKPSPIPAAAHNVSFSSPTASPDPHVAPTVTPPAYVISATAQATSAATHATHAAAQTAVPTVEEKPKVCLLCWTCDIDCFVHFFFLFRFTVAHEVRARGQNDTPTLFRTPPPSVPSPHLHTKYNEKPIMSPPLEYRKGRHHQSLMLCRSSVPECPQRFLTPLAHMRHHQLSK